MSKDYFFVENTIVVEVVVVVVVVVSFAYLKDTVQILSKGYYYQAQERQSAL